MANTQARAAYVVRDKEEYMAVQLSDQPRLRVYTRDRLAAQVFTSLSEAQSEVQKFGGRPVPLTELRADIERLHAALGRSIPNEDTRMANNQTEITKITFLIGPEITHCDVWFESTNPVLTGTHRRKSFPASVPIVDFMNAEISNYLRWP